MSSSLPDFLRETQTAVKSQMRVGALYEELVFAGIVTGISALTFIGLPLAVFFAVRYQYSGLQAGFLRVGTRGGNW